MRLARKCPVDTPSTQEISDPTGARYLIERSRVVTGDTVVLCHDAGPADPEGRETILKQAARMSGLGYWVWDTVANRCLLCNDEFAELFATSANDCELGRLNLTARASRLHPEDLDRFLDATHRALEDGIGYDIEYRIVNPNGRIRHCREIVDAAVDAEGQVIRLVGSVQDITHLRRDTVPETGVDTQGSQLLALAKFSMDHASDAIYWIGLDGRFEYANWTGCRMLGYELDELRAMSITDVDRDVSPDGWPATWDRVRRNAPYTFEATHHAKDGRPIPVEISIFSVNFEDRELICVFSRDITERKRTEAAQRQQRLQAERSNRLKTEFLARMSHELRTPLNAIIGFAEVISGNHLGPQGAARYPEFGANILTSARYLNDLIKDVLDLTQIEMGAEVLAPESFDVAAVTETACTIVRPMAKRAGVEIRVDRDLPLPELLADPRRLLQILVNLLSNGVKHTPPGSDVLLTVRHRRDAGWSFAVADRGPGIAPEDIPVALSVFGQIRNAASDKLDEGVGLGLPIVKALVERHEGTLEFEPRDGGGMVVTAHIPDGRVAPAGSPPSRRSASLR